MSDTATVFRRGYARRAANARAARVVLLAALIFASLSHSMCACAFTATTAVDAHAADAIPGLGAQGEFDEFEKIHGGRVMPPGTDEATRRIVHAAAGDDDFYPVEEEPDPD